jgi:hypothetical protein
LFIKVHFIRYLLHKMIENSARPPLRWHFISVKFRDMAHVSL